MGFIVFYEKILPSVANFVVSLFGSEEELLCMVGLLEEETLAGIELNPSCPNRNVVEDTETIIQTTKVVHAKTHHPVILKLSVIQDYIAIASGVVGYAEAISLNSVPWEIAFPGKPSPLAKLQKRVSGGGGGVSGKAAQPFNWEAVRNLKMFVPEMPVIAPSIWTFKDIAYVRDELRADGISFGAVHARYGFLGSILPTLWVRKLIRGRRIHENGR
jgi:dihydroorotate dehydrogenase